jgi:hypothetical protein
MNSGGAPMALDDGNFEQLPADQTGPSRICENCGAVMKQLSALPAMSFHAAVKIFRCYQCNQVVSDQA